MGGLDNVELLEVGVLAEIEASQVESIMAAKNETHLKETFSMMSAKCNVCGLAFMFEVLLNNVMNLSSPSNSLILSVLDSPFSCIGQAVQDTIVKDETSG